MISQVCPVSVIASSLLVYSPKPLSLPPSELFFSCALIEHHLTSPLYVFLAPFVRSPSLASELQRPDGGRLRRRGRAEASYGRRHRRRQGASFLMPPEMPCPQSLAQIAQEKISTPHLLVPQSHLRGSLGDSARMSRCRSIAYRRRLGTRSFLVRPLASGQGIVEQQRGSPPLVHASSTRRCKWGADEAVSGHAICLGRAQNKKLWCTILPESCRVFLGSKPKH